MVRAISPLRSPWDSTVAAQLDLLPLPPLLLLLPLLLMLMLPPGPSRCHLVVEKLKLQQSPPHASWPGKLDWQLRAGREQERQAVHARHLEPEGGQGGVKGCSRGVDREFHAAARCTTTCSRRAL